MCPSVLRAFLLPALVLGLLTSCHDALHLPDRVGASSAGEESEVIDDIIVDFNQVAEPEPVYYRGGAG